MTDRPETRSNQRHRTREAILEGARRLMARGEPVTVAAAAALMSVSRATAYRYFSDPQALAVEAGLALSVRPYEAVVDGTTSLRARLEAVAAYMLRLTLEQEDSFRQFLAHAVQPLAGADAPRRGARRVAYYRRALADFPSGLPAAAERRLIAQLSAATGIEALVAMTDIAGLAREELPAVAAEMVAAILDRHFPSPRPTP